MVKKLKMAFLKYTSWTINIVLIFGVLGFAYWYLGTLMGFIQ
jgi:hypothetical protein